MIDEKGRLFGKVNIVDLLIILIVLAAAAFLGYHFFGPDSTVANTEHVRLTLYCEESADYAVEQLVEGAEAWDSENNVTLGTLTEWRVGDSKSYVTDANGEVIQLARDGYCSATLVVEGEGVVGSHGVTIGGTLYAVGQSMSVYFDDSKLFLRVSGIEVIE